MPDGAFGGVVAGALKQRPGVTQERADQQWPLRTFRPTVMPEVADVISLCTGPRPVVPRGCRARFRPGPSDGRGPAPRPGGV